jgi:protein-S-isoprenylcysteine O-methyltransferase Ste14
MNVGDLVIGALYVCFFVSLFVVMLVVQIWQNRRMGRVLESGDYSKIPEGFRLVFVRRGIERSQYGVEFQRILNKPTYRLPMKHPILCSLVMALCVTGFLVVLRAMTRLFM